MKVLDPPCAICPHGTLIYDGVDSLKIPSITDGGTCKSVASMALGGCFDEVHCMFLQGTFVDLCCVKPTSDLPDTPSDDIFIDTKNNTIVPDTSCKDVTINSTPNSPFPGANEDGACYSLGSNNGKTDDLCLENVFGELCLGTMDSLLCDSCDLGVSIDRCGDDGLPGVHLDCTSAIPYANEIDICNDGKFYFSSKVCFVMDDVLEYGEKVVAAVGEHKACIERTSEEECTVWLDGKTCKSCSFADASTKKQCSDGMSGVHMDCTNVDSVVDVDLCSDGTIVDLHPITTSIPTYPSSTSSASQLSDGAVFITILSILVFVLAAFRIARVRQTRNSPQQGMELTSMYRTKYGPVIPTASPIV